jgi:UDP-2,3-diacylglucosamine pyrophosphatase LpxH
MARMIGIPAYKEYVWLVAGKRFLALHGHQFDSFLVKDNVLGRLLASFYSWLQRIMISDIFDLLFNRISDRWMRVSEQIAAKAIEYAKKKDCGTVICGHTHIVNKLLKDGIQYFNTGCWNNTPSYILTIKESGLVDLVVVP